MSQITAGYTGCTGYRSQVTSERSRKRGRSRRSRMSAGLRRCGIHEANQAVICGQFGPILVPFWECLRASWLLLPHIGYVLGRVDTAFRAVFGVRAMGRHLGGTQREQCRRGPTLAPTRVQNGAKICPTNDKKQQTILKGPLWGLIVTGFFCTV